MPLTTALMAALCISSCPTGEYMIRNCTETQPGVCWPCSPGLACNTTHRVPCIEGVSWSGASSTSCTQCSPGFCPDGFVSVRECMPTSDRVCAPCPDGFQCANGTMERCGAGTHSASGMCVPDNTTAGGCAQGLIYIGGSCRSCPLGYSCTPDGEILPCKQNTYSLNGACVPCSANSRSRPGSASMDDCYCDPGYVRMGAECAPCSAGTVWTAADGCVLCREGSYCVGKTHQEQCPHEMYSSRGSAVCIECRPYSSCTPTPSAPCVSSENCSCDDGYIDDETSCVRCPAATMKSTDRCINCAAGLECRGGADVATCGLATFSPGNLSKCVRCTACPELTRRRCNATHDSVCEKAIAPLAVNTVFQEFKTRVDGDTFRMFVMIYTTALPKAQPLRVCNTQDICMQCFQGACPSFRALSGPEYRVAIEIRSDASRLTQNLEALTHTAFLMEAAKRAMAKVTPIPFVAFSRVEHTVICPGGGKWNGADCRVAKESEAPSRTWVGLLVCLVAVTMCSLCGARRREWMQVESHPDEVKS